MASPDTTVYLARRIWTLDPANPHARALRVEDGRVVQVGAAEDVSRMGARVMDLGDATVVPGLTDSHGHLAGLGRALSIVRLEGARDEAECVARLRRAPRSAFQGDWLLGRGWDQNGWPGARFPGRAALDAAFPHTPVASTRIDHHAVWVNGEALRRAGITRDTPDPAGGRIVRDAHGEPTGVLVDNAEGLMDAVVPPPTEAQLQERLRAALRRCAKVGLTGVHDAGMDVATWRQLQRWDADGALDVRVYAMAAGMSEDRHGYLAQGPWRGSLLEMRCVKFLMDGALGSRGAALHEHYCDAHEDSGLLLLEPEELEARARAFLGRGFQLAIHAIGDRANALVLDVLERCGVTREGRHRIEHAQILRREDIQRLGRMGLVASVQPTHATSDMPWAEQKLGPERLKGAYAWRSLKEAGAHLALGSDFPIENPDVLPGLYAASTRQDAQGRPEGGWYPEQRLTPLEALEGFTTGAAYASFAEGRRGQLKRGMDADFVALSQDPVESNPRDLVTKTEIILTTVNAHPSPSGRGKG